MEGSGPKPIYSHHPWRRWLGIPVVVCVALVVLYTTTAVLRRPRLPNVVKPGEYRLAMEAFEARYGQRADRIDVLSYLAEFYLSRNRPSDAVACFAEIPLTHP